MQTVYLILVMAAVAAIAATGIKLYKTFHGSLIKRTVCTLLFALLFSFIFETFAYNHDHFLTSSYESLPDETLKTVTENEREKAVSLEFDNTEVKNIYIDCYAVNISDNKPGNCATEVKTVATDSANKNGIASGSHSVVKNSERSKYIDYNLSDKVTKIELTLSCPDDDYRPEIRSVNVNVRVPMMFSVKRLVIIFMIIMILYLLRPGSELYRWVSEKKYARNISFVVFIILSFSAVLYALLLNGADAPFFRFSEQRQYAVLAEALSRGEFTIGAAPEGLREMVNPYDYGARTELINEGKIPYIWDTAYFEGNYYVYFGVVPCVILYLPYYLITGGQLNNAYAYLIFAAAFITASFFLTELVRKRTGTTMSPLAVHVFTTIATCGSIVFLSKYADLYCIPIICGLFLSVTGILLWLRSTEREKKVSAVYAFFGTLAMALVIGARPQLFITALLAIPVFWDSVFKRRTLFSGKSIGATIAFLIPFVIVAIPVMYYNYSRFGSVLDFGANYNLTSNDMTVRGWSIARIPSAVFAYFIKPPELKGIFPFLKASNVRDILYQGTIIADPMYGCVFAQMLLWFVPLGFFGRIRKKLMEKKLFMYFVMLCAFCAALAVADAQVAGMLERYLADFTFLMYGALLLVFISLWENISIKENRAAVAKIVFFAAALTVAYLFLMGFVSQERLVGVSNVNPERFFRYLYGISFWL